MNTGWEAALEMQGILLGQINNPFWAEMVALWLHNREDRYGRYAMLPCAHAFNVADEIVAEAEPIFITEEMLDLTQSAMETFDPREAVHEEDFFLRNGMALLGKPFEIEDTDGFKTKWHAVTWRYVELPPEANDKDGPVPSLEVLTWWDTQDRDEWDAAHPEKIAAAVEQYRRWNIRYGVAHAVLVPLKFMSDPRHTTNEGDPKATWLTFIRVFNRLMGERIVLKSRMRPHRAIRRSAQRLGLTEVKDVVVCELRRARPRGYEWGDGDGEARYSHRFMVRGHWRNQWYPSVQRHKQKFIPAYVKGPDDKPFLDKKRVWIWDR